jgi:hypothetical protein
MSGKATCSADRIRSRTAACPDDVRSRITQHRASGSGVNCPWGSGWTKQSSTSPAAHKDGTLQHSASAGLLKHSGDYVYRLLTIRRPCILPGQCTYVFRVILTINSDCFPKQH